MSELQVFDWESIGQGSFSTIYKGELDSTPVAVKRLKFRNDGRYLEEATILMGLDHENIVKCLGTFENTEGTLDIVLELACGTLASALHRDVLPTPWKRSTIYQIANGLAFMHDEGVLHLDLKPPNILFTDRGSERVLIADFGMAVAAPEAYRAGARKFRAPDETFTQRSDVYSLASIACCIFHERNPDSPEETAESVAYVLECYDFEGDIAWLHAMTNGVDIDGDVRPTAEQFRDAFELSPAHELEWIGMSDESWPELCAAVGECRRADAPRSCARRQALRSSFRRAAAPPPGDSLGDPHLVGDTNYR